MKNSTTGPLKLSRTKRFVFAVVTFVVPVIAILLLTEAFMRMKGFSPLVITPAIISIEPPGNYFTGHPTRGYAHLPGTFKLTVPQPYSFKVTHSNKGLRITHPMDDRAAGEKKELWIFGCSFTHGWRLNDEETYPWILQQHLPEYEVVNFGVDGYGTVQSLIQFKESLAGGGKKPAIVVMAYAWFQDPRNALTRSWAKALFINNHLGVLNFPYGTIGGNGELVLHNERLRYFDFALLRYSALAQYLDEQYNANVEGSYQSHEVSKAVLNEFRSLCKANGIEFVLAGIYAAPLTDEMLKSFDQKGALTIDLSVDMSLQENASMPYDAHPSAFANKQFAKKLESFLRARVIDQTGKS